MHRVQSWVVGDGVTELGVVLHGARSERIHPQIHRELAVRETSEVGYQVTLGHFSDRHHVLVQVGARHELIERESWYSGRAQLVGRTIRYRHLKERGLALVSHD